MRPSLSIGAATLPPAADSVTGAPPAPDTVTPIIQWLFQRSPWVMWGGAIAALVVLFYLVRWLRPRRHQVGAWIRSRSTIVKFALVGSAFVATGLAAGTGYKSYQFVETDKRFCNGCHIFVPHGQSLARPDTGFYTVVPKLEGKHDTVSCHTCHPLNPTKEAVKLFFWMSGIRGDRIPPHGKVPRKICESCHVRGAANKTWQAIALTAGHRAHLESDSTALKGKVECLTCHAQTAHRFQPADSTCVRDGCHLTKDTRIKLGMMTGQTDLHCTVCHKFTKPVPALATRDSAAGSLRPDLKQCLSCHKMELLVPNFAIGSDPHSGTCGMCHNPHVQLHSGDARFSCATAGCHADWRKVVFHKGAAHGKRAEQCTLCHQPHAARVDASDCVGCHNAVRGRSSGTVRPPLPFDTLKALRHSLAPPPHPPAMLVRGPDGVGGIIGVGGPIALGARSGPGGIVPPGADRPGWAAAALPNLPTNPSDTFPHPRHKKLACLTCHLSQTGEKLTFVPPRGCQICHHQAPERGVCASCHTKSMMPPGIAVDVSIVAAGKPAHQRSLQFRHEKHAGLKCTNCHSEPVTMRPADSVVTCKGCHDNHHEAGRDCSWCHRTAAIKEPHARPARVHVACDACHPTAAIAALTPTRSFCLACHGTDVDHQKDRECTACHLQATPGQYRPRLLRVRTE